MAGLAILDGDLLAYRCSAAHEKRTVEAQHNETLEVETFNTITDFKSWIAEDGNHKAEDFTLTTKQTPEPVENALSTLKQMVESITKKAGCDSYHVVISGKDNFRLDLPLPTRYKGNRKDLAKPVLLADCEQYLIKHHDAEISVGCEADDLLVEYAHQGYLSGEYVVQCTLDKDAKHGPSWVFDWVNMDKPQLIEGFGELQLIEKNKSKDVKGFGRIFFYYQTLFGDVVDGYKPCQLAKVKFGEVGAYNLLKDCKTDKEALTVVANQYKKWYPVPLMYYAWDDKQYTKSWVEIMQIYVDAAHMRRWQDDKIDVEKLLTKMEII